MRIISKHNVYIWSIYNIFVYNNVKIFFIIQWYLGRIIGVSYKK